MISPPEQVPCPRCTSAPFPRPKRYHIGGCISEEKTCVQKVVWNENRERDRLHSFTTRGHVCLGEGITWHWSPSNKLHSGITNERNPSVHSTLKEPCPFPLTQMTECSFFHTYHFTNINLTPTPRGPPVVHWGTTVSHCPSKSYIYYFKLLEIKGTVWCSGVQTVLDSGIYELRSQ